MVNEKVHIVMPVKDALPIAERALRALKGYPVTIWNDNSTPENTDRLHALAQELHFECIDVAQLTDHPSPNYLLLLQTMQQRALQTNAPLIIVESDVIIQPDTIERMIQAVHPGVGMVAAVTVNEAGEINFPYEYARNTKEDGPCKKRFSFCCTLLTNELLRAYDFAQLDPSKNWYDVHISHKSLQLGFENILQISNPVLHLPHSSRPWKKLKYTNPFRYYWQKLFYGRDKI